MLKKQPADDLFEKSSMTFGEHLEELRKALAKAFIWLGIGTALGLMAAKSIVLFIGTPLKQAIIDTVVEQAKKEYKTVNGDEPSDALARWMATTKMMPERVFVDPAAIPSIVMSAAAPAADVNDTLASEDANDTLVSEDNVKPTIATEKTLGLDQANPWKGVSVEQLNRMKPFVLWRPIPSNLVSLEPTEGFMIWLKAGLMAGVVIGSPGIFWHIWQFLAAGLYPHERRYVYWYLPLSLTLFLGGVGLAFFVVLRLVLGFLMAYTNSMDVALTPRLNEYMSFALFLPLGFGIAFQLPILMLGLHRFGVITVETYISQWRIAILAIAFLSMILTPAEIYSMIGMFVPLTGLYFFGIFLCKYMPKGAGIGATAHDP